MTAGTTSDPVARLWPIVVAHDRYHGVYTGGEWVAIPNADRVPFDDTVWADDDVCADWAATQLAAGRLGVGATPQQAYDDLLVRHGAFRATAAATTELLLDRLERAADDETVTLAELAQELGVHLDHLQADEAARSDS
jgi:hypothetical protein